MGVGDQRLLTSGKETRYPLYRKQGGSHGRYGRVQKISSPPDRPARSESLHLLHYPGPWTLRSTSLSSQYKQSAGKVNLSPKKNAKLITEFAAAQLEKQFLNFRYGTLITRFPTAKIWNPSLTRPVQSTCDYRISLTLPTDHPLSDEDFIRFINQIHFTCDISKGVFHALTTKASSQKSIYSYSPVLLLLSIKILQNTHTHCVRTLPSHTLLQIMVKTCLPCKLKISSPNLSPQTGCSDNMHGFPTVPPGKHHYSTLN
jgi:hypothetical protein